jgi:cyclic beta-1,2-glucan synthetase
MDGDPADPVRAGAIEAGHIHSAWRGDAPPDAVPAWKEIERAKRWLGSALKAASRAEPAASSAAEWLLDNGFQVQRAILQVMQDLPKGFYHRLRQITDGPAKGEPLVLAIAHDLLHTTHFQLSREAILTYLTGYQERVPLDIAELWALPSLLRIACLERLISGFSILFPTVRAPFAASASCRQFSQESDPGESVARGIANLRVISSIVWKDVFDAASLVEQTLAAEPCGVYPSMDFDTRDTYRRTAERLAGRSALSEVAVAVHAVALASSSTGMPAKHVGHWLLGAGLPELERQIGARQPSLVRLSRLLLRHPGPVYTISLFLLGLVGLVVPAAYLASSGATLLQWALGIGLSALPATVLSVTLVNWLVTLIVPPTRLPKLDFTRAIDPAWPTLVVMPVIVGDTGEVPALMSRLEAHFLANPTAHGFALLSDPVDAQQERAAGDALVEQALREGIEALNHRHGRTSRSGPFSLLHRSRRFNPAQDCWMAWERKRGKLEEFNAFLLTGKADAFAFTAGPVRRLAGAVFVVTADADTRLPPGSVARLAGTLAHPLNWPFFDNAGRVVAGYTVLQPRVEIAPHGSDSLFARLFGGDTAIDIYSRAVSDVYQDLVGTGNFVGKGIYDVAAFARSVEGLIPENNLLSHDLWEGLHGRAGLASDIIVYESFPESYGEYVRRWHRWVRGDWQLLPWLLPRVPGTGDSRVRNRLTSFDRLRLWDNMRRSLVPPSVLLLLLGGWFVLPGQPLVWTLLAILAPGAWLFTDLVTGVARGRRRGVLVGTFHQAGEHLGRWAMSVAFLVSDAAVALHAIGITLLRLRSGQRLLEWTSAAQVSRELAKAHPRAAQWRNMWHSPLAALMLVVPLAAHSQAFAAAAPLLCIWLLAPEIAWWTGRRRQREVQVLDTEARAFLRLVARRSWLYFENHVRPEDNWLPPDNHQEEPIEATAHRTSPTNIGMMVLSALSAWRLGHIGTGELSIRMRDTLDTLDRLERWCGHFLNWYDTGTLARLEPRYVSTVDSGNLAVSLVTLARGCSEIADRPAFDASRWQGLEDCLALLGGAVTTSTLQGSAHAGILIEQLRREIAAAGDEPSGWPALLERCEASCAAIRLDIVGLLDSTSASPPGSLRDLRNWLERSEHHLRSMRRDLEAALPWLAKLASPPKDCCGIATEFAVLLAPDQPLRNCGEIARSAEELRSRAEAEAGSPEARQWLTSLASDIRHGLAFWRQLDRRLRTIERRASAFADAMDFTPLYDPNERLFHIGYDLSADRIDPHHYDLLASEARLASFFAIAKHDVPPEHWFQLGRPIVKRRGELALVSWNGSMFEYLMPNLFLRSDPDTLLGESDRSAVDIQRRYAASEGIPWGISESGFASVGPDGAWRYRAFGVPALGLRRGLTDDLVVAPYASALALAVRPLDAVANMRSLAKMGVLGRCGFYEALDFTAARRTEEHKFAPVQSYMAHHQGMAIAAIANALFGDMFVRWFHADARVQTVELILNERVPWELPAEIEHLEPQTPPVTDGTGLPRPQPWEPLTAGRGPAMHLLGNGRLSTRIAADGAGELGWKGFALTRPGEAQGGNGHFIYLRDTASGAMWSATAAPVGSGQERRTIFHAHKAEFRCRAEEISSTLEILAAPAEDVEIRRLRLVNGSAQKRTIEVASLAEIALAPSADWLRHPAFARLFVTAETHPELDALLFTRRARNPGEPTPVMVQRFVHQEGARLTGWEVARTAARRRHGGAADYPLFSDGTGERPQHPLDPASALRAEVTLPPHGEAALAFVTAVAATRDDALELARRYGSLGSLDWAEQDAASRAVRDLHSLGLPAGRIAEAQLLFSALHTRPGPRIFDPGEVSRDDLWAMGLSGDLPILRVELSDEFDIGELRFVLAAQRLWRWHGTSVDIALVHPGMPGYIEPLRERIVDVLREMGSQELLGERGGIHLFGRNQMQPERLAALEGAAAISLADGGGSVASQLARQAAQAVLSPPFIMAQRDAPLPLELPKETAQLRFANGFGGFDERGDYRIELSDGQTPPAPWANVLANETFGSIVTEAGLGYTFAGNSGENRLTPWHNDPLADPQGEVLYLRDEERGEVWSPTPLPSGGVGACHVVHGRGESRWRRESQGLVQEVVCRVAQSDPVKLIRVRLANRLAVPRRITATFFADWLLGAVQGEPGPFRKSWYHPERYALLAQNRWHRDFTGRTAFLAATVRPHSLTTSRSDFLGAVPNWRRPEGLAVWSLGDRTVNHGEDAAAALQVHVDLPAHGSSEFAFILGQAESEDEAAAMVDRWQNASRAETETQQLAAGWERLCGALAVSTPDPAFDLMVNHWLPYQTVSSRLFARAGFYQAGGAFGFRDQLQDVLALLLAEPELAKAQILRAAAHQFEEGDVLHWWHPPSGRGVRTRCSDDLLWLPFAVARYIAATGDGGLLDERVPFLQAPELRDDEHDRYAQYPVGGDASILEHCLRAFERAWRLGAHGLPLIGEGDWNDGMNRVGIGMKGESVWLAWFMVRTIRDFAPIAEGAQRTEFATRWLPRADRLIKAVERHGWDGDWYLRAFDDLGRPWGSHLSGECRIDSLSQSWAVVAGGGDPERAAAALDAAFAQLVRPDDGIVRLLDPPFADTPRDPGYIKAYPPGIRENGGQYSHAAAWLGIACALRGDGDRAKAVFDRLNPILHADSNEKAKRYLVEPYVVAGDIGGAPPHTGRGGWSWYTGAAAWSWRLAVENILGIVLIGAKIELAPCLPSDWAGFRATVRGRGVIEISIVRGREASFIVDGKPTPVAPVEFPGEGNIRRVELVLATLDDAEGNPAKLNASHEQLRRSATTEAIPK